MKTSAVALAVTLGLVTLLPVIARGEDNHCTTISERATAAGERLARIYEQNEGERGWIDGPEGEELRDIDNTFRQLSIEVSQCSEREDQ